MPNAPAAPGLFSTTNFCPRVGSMISASMREVMSLPPPTAAGTTISIGRDGNFSCATAGGAAPSALAHAAPITSEYLMRMVILPPSKLFMRKNRGNGIHLVHFVPQVPLDLVHRGEQCRCPDGDVIEILFRYGQIDCRGQHPHLLASQLHARSSGLNSRVCRTQRSRSGWRLCQGVARSNA